MNNEDKSTREMLENKFDELFGDLDDDILPEAYETQTIILNDENGEEIEFEFLDLISYDGEEYVVLLPIEECDAAGAVVILKIDTIDDEQESYASVDDAITMAVFNIFKDKFKDEFNFID